MMDNVVLQSRNTERTILLLCVTWIDRIPVDPLETLHPACPPCGLLASPEPEEVSIAQRWSVVGNRGLRMVPD